MGEIGINKGGQCVDGGVKAGERFVQNDEDISSDEDRESNGFDQVSNYLPGGGVKKVGFVQRTSGTYERVVSHKIRANERVSRALKNGAHREARAETHDG
jgi:hypothetical protein